MTRSRLTLIAVTALTLALALAAPAGALSTHPLAVSFHLSTVEVAKTGTAKSPHTCQAGRGSEKAHTKAPADIRNPPVVACEQPPRSQIEVPSLKGNASAALAAFG